MARRIHFRVPQAVAALHRTEGRSVTNPFSPRPHIPPPGRLAQFFRRSDREGAEAAIVNMLAKFPPLHVQVELVEAVLARYGLSRIQGREIVSDVLAHAVQFVAQDGEITDEEHEYLVHLSAALGIEVDEGSAILQRALKSVVARSPSLPENDEPESAAVSVAQRPDWYTDKMWEIQVREAERQRVWGRYFGLMSDAGEASSVGDYRKCLFIHREALAFLPTFIASQMKWAKRFDIRTIPAISSSARLLAIYEDESELKNLKALVLRIPELNPWAAEVQEAIEEVGAIRARRLIIEETPGITQGELKKRGYGAMGSIGNVLQWMEKCGIIRREGTGPKAKLYPGQP